MATESEVHKSWQLRWYHCGQIIKFKHNGREWESPTWVCRRYVGHDGDCSPYVEDSTRSTNEKVSERA